MITKCFQEVTRKGIVQACFKPAVGLREDDGGGPYPVCAYHAREPMIPLHILFAAGWVHGHDMSCGRSCQEYQGLGEPCDNPFMGGEG